MRGQQLLNGRDRNIFLQLDGKRLAVAAQRTDARTDHRPGSATRWRILFVSAWPFHSSRLWPLSSCLSIHGIGLPRQRHAKVIDRQVAAAGQRRHFALDIENRGSRVRQLACHVAMQLAHLSAVRAYDARRRRSRTVSRHADPLYQVMGKQAAEGHQHQAHRTVAADEGLMPLFRPAAGRHLVNRVE